MRPLKIYLADLTYTTLSLATEAFPLNIGFVGAYCKARFGSDVQITPFKYIPDLDQVLRDAPPDILGMSNYPWNHHLGRQFFRMARALSPSTICVMGGPNIPLDDALRGQFLLGRPEIDFYAYLEGEEPFSNLVARVLEVGPEREKLKREPIPGLVTRVSDTELLLGAFLPRRKNLDEIPSPYLTGFLDKFFDGQLSPLLETNRGCPFSCTFCHEGNALITKVNYFSVERVKAELDYVAERVPPTVHNLMFADPNFAMYERDYEICDHIARIQDRRDWPTNIFASTGKNKKERIASALRRLKGTMKLWMSVQSMDLHVLEQIKRDNISLDTMMSLSEVFAEFGVPTYSEIILALPGETYESHVRSVSAVVEAGVDTVSLYTLMLLNGTELSLPETRRKYGIESHFRILPRDFGKLSNGEVAVEIEEVCTATHTLSFEEYQKARGIHLVVNVVCNGKGFGPLFKLFKENQVPFFDLIYGVVENIHCAPEPVRRVFDSFVRLTREELWDSEEELRAFASREENYARLLSGELGANLIQVHLAKSLRIMEDWAEFIFMVAEDIFRRRGLAPQKLELLAEVKRFCKGRVHNLWGEDRGADNPVVSFHYDVTAWCLPTSKMPLEGFQLAQPKWMMFAFPPDLLQEMNDYIKRFGLTDTGIGRILFKANTTKIWRQAFPVEEATVRQALEAGARAAV